MSGLVCNRLWVERNGAGACFRDVGFGKDDRPNNGILLDRPNIVLLISRGDVFQSYNSHHDVTNTTWRANPGSNGDVDG